MTRKRLLWIRLPLLYLSLQHIFMQPRILGWRCHRNGAIRPQLHSLKLVLAAEYLLVPMVHLRSPHRLRMAPVVDQDEAANPVHERLIGTETEVAKPGLLRA